MLVAILAYDKGLRGVDREQAVALADQALQTGSLDGYGSGVLSFAPHLLGWAGEPRAIAVFDDVVAAARLRGDVLNAALGLAVRGLFKKRFGDLLAAESDAREGLSLAEQLGAPLIVLYAAVGVADVLLELARASPQRRRPGAPLRSDRASRLCERATRPRPAPARARSSSPALRR